MKLFVVIISLFIQAHAGRLSTDLSLDHPFYKDLPLFLEKPLSLNFNPWMQPCSKRNIIELLKMVSADSSSRWQSLANKYLCELLPGSCENTATAPNLFTLGLSAAKDTFKVYPVLEFETAIQDSHFNIDGIRTLADNGAIGAVTIDSMGHNLEGVVRVHTGLCIDGNVGNLALYFKGAINTRYASREAWTKTNDPRRGIMLSNIFERQDKLGHIVGYENFVAFASYSTAIADFKVGQDAVKWGESEKRGLALSGTAAPMLHLKVTRNIGPVDFQFVLAKLTADTYNDSRLLYAKRIVWSPTKKLSFGFNDQVITINRNFEPYYFIPVLPFYFAEHFVGDLDNRLMGFDASVKFSYLTFYTQFHMDDMRNLVGVFNDSDVSNKWAFLCGLRFTTPFKRAISQGIIEFSQVEPWVYTTSARLNYDTTIIADSDGSNVRIHNRQLFNYPVHYGKLIGNGLGPNSRSISLKLLSRFSNRLRGEWGVEWIVKGSGAGSAVTDQNLTYIDTVKASDNITDSLVIYPYTYDSKEKIRFANLAINRAVLTAKVAWRPKIWLENSFQLTFIHDNAILAGNYLQLVLNSRMNF